MVEHVHQLGVSRSKKIRLEVCRYLHIDGRIFFELSTFLDSPRMRRWGQFIWSTPIRGRVSASSPCCSPDTQPLFRDVYLENSGEVLPKFCLGSKQPSTSCHCPLLLANGSYALALGRDTKPGHHGLVRPNIVVRHETTIEQVTVDGS